MKLRILALFLAILSVFSVFTMTGCSENGGDKQNETEENDKQSVKPTIGDFEGTSWINALEFGFVNDGKTPNDKVMKEYIKYYGRTPIYFTTGSYAFEKTINFPEKMFIYMDPTAELKCIAEEPLEYFITLQYGVEDWGTFDEYAHQSFIQGGKINANYKAKVALGLHGGLHTAFADFQIRNVLEKGIVTETSELANGCYQFNNIYFYNDQTYNPDEKQAPTGTIAIYDNSADNKYIDCTAVNFETFIYTGGGKFAYCSAWFNNYGKHLIKDSVFAYVVGGNQSVFTQPCIDTYRTGFKVIPNENGNYPSTSITDLVWITNNVFYTCGQYEDDRDNNMQRDYPMIIFDVESDKSRLMVNGMYIPWREWGFRFSNIPLPNSSFTNVRYEAGWDPWNHLANFRDDTARIRDGKSVMSFSDLPSHGAWHK